jgi:hypothetical protein
MYCEASTVLNCAIGTLKNLSANHTWRKYFKLRLLKLVLS